MWVSPVLGVPLEGFRNPQDSIHQAEPWLPKELWLSLCSGRSAAPASLSMKLLLPGRLPLALQSPLPCGPFPVPGDYTTHERLFLSRRQRCYTTSLMTQMRGSIYSSPSLVLRPFTNIQMPPSGRVLENRKQPRGRAPCRGPHRDFPPRCSVPFAQDLTR